MVRVEHVSLMKDGTLEMMTSWDKTNRAMRSAQIAGQSATAAIEAFNEALPVAEVAGKLVCKNCGASAEAKHRNRFLSRHPAKCQAAKKEAVARGALAKQLATSTRSVDADEVEEE